jgi:hypothetical protein
MVFPHRRALRARLLPFRYMDGPYLKINFSSRRLGVEGNKVMAGRTPANPRTLDEYEGKPGWFSLIAGRFARGCSHSGIWMGLI